MADAQPDRNEEVEFAQDVRAATAGIVLIAAVLGMVVFQYLGPIIKPLFVAAFLYYLVTPAAEMLIQRGVRRWLAYLVAMFLLAALMVVFGFVVYANAQAVERRYPFYREKIIAWADRLAVKTRVVGKARPEPLLPLGHKEQPPQEETEASPNPEETPAEPPPEAAGNVDHVEPELEPQEPAPDELRDADDEVSVEEREVFLPEDEPRRHMPEIPAAAGPAGPGPLGDLFDISASDVIGWGIGTAFGFIANMVAVLFYLTFIILEAHQFPGRLRRAFKEDTVGEFMEFGRQVTHSVRQYLVLKTIVSLGTGFAAALIMLIFGLEFWPLWGILTFLLNYVPYVGPLAATVCPILIGFLQFTNPWLASLMSLLLLANQQIWGNVVEPQLLGKHLNISPLALLIFIAYWGWLWGIVGMVLSVPLAVFIKMLLAFFPRTRKVAILISAD